jgi:diguanylate cyclase (GGDEF)-like protein
MNLDPKSLLVAAACVTIACAASLALFWLEHRRNLAVTRGAQGFALLALALALLLGRNAVPDLLSVVLANVLLVVSNLLILSSIRLFAGLPEVPRRVIVVVALVTAAWFVAFSEIWPDLLVRIGFNTVVVATIAMVGSWACLRCGPPNEQPRRLLGWMLLGHGLFLATSILALLALSSPGNELYALQSFVIPRALEATSFAVFLPVLITQIVAARLQREHEQASVTDPLTGVPNRRGFEATALREIMRRDEAAPVVMVAVTDVDHFKRVNDQYGHQTGDQVLIAVARALGGTLRPAELMGRVGGEEFAVVIRLTDARHASSVTERLRIAVETLSIPMDGGESTSVTCSTGYVALALSGAGERDVDSARALFEHLYGRADAAMYVAKTGGRNRSVEGSINVTTEEESSATANV